MATETGATAKRPILITPEPPRPWPIAASPKRRASALATTDDRRMRNVRLIMAGEYEGRATLGEDGG